MSPSSPRGSSSPSRPTIFTSAPSSAEPSDDADRPGGSETVHIVVRKFSDRPYRLSVRQPSSSRERSTIAPGIGDPAQTHSRMLPASCLAGSYAAISICRNGVAVTAAVHPYCSIRLRPSCGSHASIRYDFAPASSGRTTLVTRPVLWVIGDGPNWTSRSVYSRLFMIAVALARTVLKVWKQPFGRDVVPEVYTIRKPSSGEESGPASSSRAARPPSTTRLSRDGVASEPAARATYSARRSGAADRSSSNIARCPNPRNSSQVTAATAPECRRT